MKTRMTVYGIALAVCAVVLSCTGEQTPAGQPGTESRIVAQSAATDPRVVIAGLQEELKPDGKSLTEKQIADINAAFDPAHPRESMKTVMGLLTSEQKTVMVNNIEKKLKKTGQSLDSGQIRKYMEYGPKSDTEWSDILTPAQKQVLLNAQSTR